VGLANTRERLQVLYGNRQQFSLSNREPHGVEIRIELPFEAMAKSNAA
jgi:LytS/YehU family sensor histidine kinase